MGYIEVQMVVMMVGANDHCWSEWAQGKWIRRKEICTGGFSYTANPTWTAHG
jgi:hypothetical protein